MLRQTPHRPRRGKVYERKRRYSGQRGQWLEMMEDVAEERNSSAVGSAAAEPATVFSALAEIIYQGSETNQVYAALCVAATLVVKGCDHASLLVRRDNRYVTVGASDRIAQRIDDMERMAGDGPCVDAIEEEAPQIETDLTAPNQWPNLAARLVAETPVRGAMGFRILVDRRKTGALNLFSDTPGVFDTEAAGQAIVLASFASVAINAVAQGEDVATLRRGLMSNREIGKAVGMLMMLHGVSEHEAFDVLRKYSQDLNIKLADVARMVIQHRGNAVFGGEDRPLGKT
jgi:transcriptional regulator with GAF, ATPase, and Fis domain